MASSARVAIDQGLIDATAVRGIFSVVLLLKGIEQPFLSICGQRAFGTQPLEQLDKSVALGGVLVEGTGPLAVLQALLSNYGDIEATHVFKARQN